MAQRLLKGGQLGNCVIFSSIKLTNARALLKEWQHIAPVRIFQGQKAPHTHSVSDQYWHRLLDCLQPSIVIVRRQDHLEHLRGRHEARQERGTRHRPGWTPAHL